MALKNIASMALIVILFLTPGISRSQHRQSAPKIKTSHGTLIHLNQGRPLHNGKLRVPMAANDTRFHVGSKTKRLANVLKRLANKKVTSKKTDKALTHLLGTEIALTGAISMMAMPKTSQELVLSLLAVSVIVSTALNRDRSPRQAPSVSKNAKREDAENTLSSIFDNGSAFQK